MNEILLGARVKLSDQGLLAYKTGGTRNYYRKARGTVVGIHRSRIDRIYVIWDGFSNAVLYNIRCLDVIEMVKNPINDFKDLYTRWKIAQIFYSDHSPAPEFIDRDQGEKIKKEIDREIERTYFVR